ncbi:amidohydrolase [Nocardiopsis ansamitocini]|uniref:Amidohydrolase n=1 Tax=Nocardiopsis ansamitocini TaxID=1670832 RepID=A0A9W6P8T6_9ACTN|nr:amidohydrolase [Nocardiopsis ansamitocini]GLU49088.1 amidohydrolase [Nocardiopsis ansamitocini]
MTSTTAADLVVRGPVYTCDAAGSWASAFAVRDGRIAAVGGAADVADLVGPGTEVVEVDDAGAVVPGFVDSHVHPLNGGLERLRCDLSGARTRHDCLETIAEYTRTRPGAGWVRGGGWSFDAFPGGVPDAADLDAIDATRPMAFYNRDHHTLWVNSRAMELAGIDAATPDPVDGRIERRADGSPCGALQEGAMTLVERVLPDLSPDELRAGLLAGQEYLHSLGVTAWQDAKVHERDFGVYADLVARGELSATVVGAMWWDRHAGLDQLAGLTERRAEAARRGLSRFDSVKVMLDGVCENFTAAMLDPYVGSAASADLGTRFFAQDDLERYVVAMDAAGLQVHFHAVGDAAVRQGLDAVAAARSANGDTGRYHHIAHVQVVHPDDLPRFRALRVAVNAQPLWARYEPQMTDLTIPFFAEHRVGWQYPFGDFVRHGAVLAMGSDWPVSTPDPVHQIHVAVNRTPVPVNTAWTPEQGVFFPEQRITLAQALRAFTMGSAFVSGLANTHGSIEVGKTADFAVLDRNPFAGPPADIHRSRVRQTRVAGRTVFEAG